MADKVIVTEEGFRKLHERLSYLKDTARPEIVARIKIARDFGDLSENAEYAAAKDEQALIESEIAELEAKIKVAEIVTTSNVNKNIVSVGCKVTIERDKKTTSYEIVGTSEADIYKNKISNDSPLGAALIGKKKGETVLVVAPARKYEVKVVDIEY